MNLRAGLYSFLLGAASTSAMTDSDIEVQCRCTCKMRPLVPEVVCSDERLETLCTAVSALPELADTLSREDVVYTIFAPTDEGFANLPAGALDTLLSDPAALENLLLNHVVVGFQPICYEDLVCGNLMFMANGSQRGQRTKTACSFGDGGSGGDDATGGPGEEPTVISQKGDGNGGSKGNMPNIVGPDTRAKNGVLHIVNNVILQKDSIPAPPCTGGTSCGNCKGECQASGGCRFSKTGWCKRDCEERFGWDNGALCPKDGDDDGDDQPAKVCFGGFDCASCQAEMKANEGCGREPTEEGLVYCEEKWGACQCTGGTSCGDCKGECSREDGCRFSKSGWCKRDCEERFGKDTGALCPKDGDDDGDDQPAKVCFGSDHCVGCKQEMVDQEGCGREPVGEGLVYCEEKYGKCPF